MLRVVWLRSAQEPGHGVLRVLWLRSAQEPGHGVLSVLWLRSAQEPMCVQIYRFTTHMGVGIESIISIGLHNLQAAAANMFALINWVYIEYMWGVSNLDLGWE